MGEGYEWLLNFIILVIKKIIIVKRVGGKNILEIWRIGFWVGCCVLILGLDLGFYVCALMGVMLKWFKKKKKSLISWCKVYM